MIIERLRKYGLKLNPNKCVLGATSGKLVGFIVRHCEIERDPSKIIAFRNGSVKKRERSKGFYWSYQLNRLFYSQIDSCQCNFEGIKTYLLNPPTCTFSAGHPLLMYLVIHETSMGCVLAKMTKQVRRSKQSITSARIHQLRVLLFCLIENVLCFCVGHIEIMPLFVV